MTARPKFATHEAYLDTLAPEVRSVLVRIGAEVEARVPGAQRCIGYGMPAYRKERIFFYFGAFQHHVGIYPPVQGDAALQRELAPYRGPKGNLAFRFREPIPYALIGRVAEALAAQYAKSGS